MEAEDVTSLKPPRGTHDILPEQTRQWQHLEKTAREVFQTAGYGEIRTPIFEHTELFKRGVGDTTDIVNKEMYTFLDKSDRSVTLRPEGTAGVVRAFLNGGMHRRTPPVKLWYTGPMFRYERAQTGRQRQFHQIGIEAFGSSGPLIDAEVIILALSYLEQIGIKQFELQLNSIGDSICRPAYRQLLKDFLRPKLPLLCKDCQDRFERNPLRMLDCKIESCQAQYKGVPTSLEHLCVDCKSHWDDLLKLLDHQKIKYSINPKLVRGLDYYTRTVMEIVSDNPKLGVQSTICAGGRYDNLVETLGGAPTAAVGWALGMERILLLLDNAETEPIHVFIVSSNQAAALNLASHLRKEKISCIVDFPGTGATPRAFGKQLQQADKVGATLAIILGDEELASNEVTLKNMQTGTQEKISTVKLAGVIHALDKSK